MEFLHLFLQMDYFKLLLYKRTLIHQLRTQHLFISRTAAKFCLCGDSGGSHKLSPVYINDVSDITITIILWEFQVPILYSHVSSVWISDPTISLWPGYIFWLPVIILFAKDVIALNAETNAHFLINVIMNNQGFIKCFIVLKELWRTVDFFNFRNHSWAAKHCEAIGLKINIKKKRNLSQ